MLKPVGSAVKFNRETVETLSEKVKTNMLDLNKWKDKTVVVIHYLNYTIHNQNNIFTYIRQLEFSILELWIMVRKILISEMKTD
jgi:hypothetical protein